MGMPAAARSPSSNLLIGSRRNVTPFERVRRKFGLTRLRGAKTSGKLTTSSLARPLAH
jgi:hypothetical protein